MINYEYTCDQDQGML